MNIADIGTYEAGGRSVGRGTLGVMREFVEALKSFANGENIDSSVAGVKSIRSVLSDSKEIESRIERFEAELRKEIVNPEIARRAKKQEFIKATEEAMGFVRTNFKNLEDFRERHGIDNL